MSLSNVPVIGDENCLISSTFRLLPGYRAWLSSCAAFPTDFATTRLRIRKVKIIYDDAYTYHSMPQLVSYTTNWSSTCSSRADPKRLGIAYMANGIIRSAVNCINTVLARTTMRLIRRLLVWVQKQAHWCDSIARLGQVWAATSTFDPHL